MRHCRWIPTFHLQGQHDPEEGMRSSSGHSKRLGIDIKNEEKY
jgi:hypothetical protein